MTCLNSGIGAPGRGRSLRHRSCGVPRRFDSEKSPRGARDGRGLPTAAAARQTAHCCCSAAIACCSGSLVQRSRTRRHGIRPGSASLHRRPIPPARRQQRAEIADAPPPAAAAPASSVHQRSSRMLVRLTIARLALPRGHDIQVQPPRLRGRRRRCVSRYAQVRGHDAQFLVAARARSACFGALARLDMAAEHVPRTGQPVAIVARRPSSTRAVAHQQRADAVVHDACAMAIQAAGAPAARRSRRRDRSRCALRTVPGRRSVPAPA